MRGTNKADDIFFGVDDVLDSKVRYHETPKLYKNIFPEDAPMNISLERIKKVGEKFKNHKGYTCKGTYQYVISQNDKLFIGKNVGHIDLSLGEKVKYAGEIHFTNKGILKSWSNRSGHYIPNADETGNFMQFIKDNGISDISMENFIAYFK